MVRNIGDRDRQRQTGESLNIIRETMIRIYN